MVGSWGYAGAYAVEVALSAIAVTTLIALPHWPPEGAVRQAGFRSVLEGLAYVRDQPNLRMTFFVDLAAMVLVMPRVLFPAIGAALIGGGPTTAGSWPAVGLLTLAGAADSVTAIAGVVACVAAVLVLAVLQPRFAQYDARHPTP